MENTFKAKKLRGNRYEPMYEGEVQLLYNETKTDSIYHDDGILTSHLTTTKILYI